MSAVEALVAQIARARRDWHRDDIRTAIAKAVAPDLHRLTFNPAARPDMLAAEIRRYATQRQDPTAPPPVREVLDPHAVGSPPPDEYRQARQAISRRKP
jgi:hypothetical protein